MGQNIISHFRLNTSDMDVDDIEELEEELIDFQDFLIKSKKKRNVTKRLIGLLLVDFISKNSILKHLIFQTN